MSDENERSASSHMVPDDKANDDDADDDDEGQRSSSSQDESRSSPQPDYPDHVKQAYVYRNFYFCTSYHLPCLSFVCAFVCLSVIFCSISIQH